MKKKVFETTASQIKCKITGLQLNQADKKRYNSRAFYKLPNGEYLSKSTSAMKKYLDEMYPEQVENEGCNVDKEGKKLIHEEHRDVLKRLYDK